MMRSNNIKLLTFMLAATISWAPAGAQEIADSRSQVLAANDELEDSILAELDRLAEESRVSSDNEEQPAPTTIKVRRIRKRPQRSKSVAVKLTSSSTSSSKRSLPEMETSKPLADIKKPEDKTGWGFGYTYWATANADKLFKRTATVTGLNIISVSYALSNGIGLAVEPSFSIDYNLEQGNTKHTIGNTTLKATKSNLAKILGFDLNTALRVYLPTGESWRNSGTNGAVRADLNFARDLGSGLSFYYLFQPRYYLQSNRANAKFDEYGRLLDNAKANYGLRAINEVGVGYEFNKVLSVGQSVGIDYLFNYDDPEIGVDGANSSTFDLGTELAIKPFKNFSMSFLMTQSHGMQGKKGFSLFNSEELEYHGVFSLSL